MKKINGIVLSISFITLLGLAGCAHYNAQPLNQIKKESLLNKKEQFISFTYHIFTKNDCKKYLDRNVINKGYQPVQITFTNNSNRFLDFSTTRFSLPCVNYEEVTQKVFTSTTKRVTNYGVASLFIWPLIIPAIVDGVGSSQANEKLDRDFHQKTLQNQIVKPFSIINGLIFVPTEHFDKKFTFMVLDTENHEKFVFSTTSPQLKIKNQFIKNS